jgi:pentatricopeptide repeat protein
VLAARSTDPSWSRSLAALLPSPLSDARLAAAVSALGDHDPDLAAALLSWHRAHHCHGGGPTPLAHSALLRLLARARRFDAADAALRCISLAGAAPTRGSLGALAAAYADAGMEEKAAEACARARELHGALPDAPHCNCLLRLLVERRRWERARGLYGEMLAREGGADDYSTCVMVRGLCLEGRVEEGRGLIEARWGEGCVPGAVFYNVLIDGYCRRGDIGRGLLLLGEMETKGIMPTVVTYGAIIHWLGRKGDLAKVESLFGEMRARGLSPNVQIYNTVINALCECQSTSQASAMLNQMVESRFHPDVVTFNTMIAGFCREGDVREALKLLREAIRRGLEPNQLSYTPLIHGFCVRGEAMVASDLLVEMMGRGHTPDMITLGALIHGLVVSGQVNDALIVREKMAARQVMPDANIYNVLISGLCKKRMLSAAKNLLEEMLEQKVQPDKFIYTTLIDGFVRSDKLSDARKIFEFMEEKACPDIVAYNAMIKGYCKFGMMKEAVTCMSSMRKAGCIPDEFTYATLVDGYTKKGDISASLRLLCDMMKRRCKPNVFTYASLICGYCNIGDTYSAEDLFAKMQSEGLFPNVVHYTVLIGSLFKKNKVIQAAAYFEHMLLNHCPPNDATVHYLVNGLINCRHGMVNSNRSDTKQAHEKSALLDVFRGLISDGLDPRISAYNAIIFSLCRHNMLGKAMDLKDKMSNKGCLPDPITFLSLLYGFSSVGESGKWRSALPNEFQQDEFEIITKYMALFNQHVISSVVGEVSRILQLHSEEFQFLKQPEQRFAGS